MAILPDIDRQRVTNGLMRYWSRLLEEVAGVSAPELRAAVDATDQWIEDNQISFNNALPNPAKTNLTAAQKTILFCAVSLMRVSPAFARAVFGEVD